MPITLSPTTLQITPSSDGKLYGSNPDGDAGDVAWPPNWPIITGQALVSDLPTNTQDPNYYNIWASRDFAILQWRYPTSTEKEDQEASLGTVKSLYPDVRIYQYIHPHMGQSDSSASFSERLVYEAMNDAGMWNSWAAYSNTLGQYVWHPGAQSANNTAGNNRSPVISNAMPQDGSGRNYPEAVCQAMWDKFGTGVTQYWDGIFFDLTNITYPRMYDDPTGAGSRVYAFEHDQDGNDESTETYNGTDQGRDYYWAALDSLHSAVKTISGRSNFFFLSNHGGTGLAVQNNPTAFPALDSHPLTDKLEAPLGEFSDAMLSLEWDGAQYSIGWAGSYDTAGFRRFWLRTGVLDQLVRKDGNQYAQGIDILVNAPSVTTALTSDSRAFMRAFLCLCLLHPRYAFCPTSTSRARPCPILDEERFYLGPPLRTRQMFTFTNPADPASIVIRAPDSNGFYYETFSQGIVVFNANAPSDGAWPQAATDTLDLPDPGEGRVWRYINAATYVNPVTGRAMAGQESWNDGSIVAGGTYGQVSLKRWHGLILARGYS